MNDHLGLSKSATVTPVEYVSTRQSNSRVGPHKSGTADIRCVLPHVTGRLTCFMNIISSHTQNKPRRWVPMIRFILLFLLKEQRCLTGCPKSHSWELESRLNALDSVLLTERRHQALKLKKKNRSSCEVYIFLGECMIQSNWRTLASKK